MCTIECRGLVCTIVVKVLDVVLLHCMWVIMTLVEHKRCFPIVVPSVYSLESPLYLADDCCLVSNSTGRSLSTVS